LEKVEKFNSKNVEKLGGKLDTSEAETKKSELAEALYKRFKN